MFYIFNNGRNKEQELSLKEKDKAIHNLKQTIADKDKQSETELRGLESKLEQAEINLRQAEWDKQDLNKDNTAVVERLSH